MQKVAEGAARQTDAGSATRSSAKRHVVTAMGPERRRLGATRPSKPPSLLSAILQVFFELIDVVWGFFSFECGRFFHVLRLLLGWTRFIGVVAARILGHYASNLSDDVQHVVGEREPHSYSESETMVGVAGGRTQTMLSLQDTISRSFQSFARFVSVFDSLLLPSQQGD